MTRIDEIKEIEIKLCKMSEEMKNTREDYRLRLSDIDSKILDIENFIETSNLFDVEMAYACSMLHGCLKEKRLITNAIKEHHALIGAINNSHNQLKQALTTMEKKLKSNPTKKDMTLEALFKKLER